MMKKRVLWSLGFLIVSLGAYYSYHYYNRIYAANVVVEKGKTYIYIPTGSTSESVAEMLHQAGFIISIEDFKWLAAKKNYQGDNVVPGKYEIKNGWSNNELIRNLRAGRGRVMVKVTIGTTRLLSEMVQKVGNELELSGEDLEEYLKNPDVLDKYGFNKYNIQTLFIPNTYEFTWNTSCEEFVQRMADEYKKFWTAERKNKAKKIGLTQSQVYILASIVQSEQQRHTSEWKDIAGLYMNRINKDMLLQSDPTVVYALGDFTINRVLNDHLQRAASSPYSTYAHRGLPPGPIRFSDIGAIDAVLNYKKHNYIYMCAKPGYGGYHNFAKDNAGHEANARAYHKWLDKEGIK
jgi:UPF0755 protein